MSDTDTDTDTSVVDTAGVPADARDDPVRTGLAAIPAEVVIRHTCHCEAAVEPAAPGEPEEHVFTVDGEDFPWPLPAERNPVVTRVADDLYRIALELLLIDNETYEYLSFGYVGPGSRSPFIPVIGGRPFPWTCTADAFQLTFSYKQLPTLRLAFFARHVSGNLPIEDRRHTQAVYNNAGDLLAAGMEKCFWCDEWVDGDMLAHHDEKHSERVRTTPDGHKTYRVS